MWSALKFEARLHIDGYGYGYRFGYGDRERQDFENLGKDTRTHTGYVSYRVRVRMRVRVRGLEEVPMLHRLEVLVKLLIMKQGKKEIIR